MFCQKKVLG